MSILQMIANPTQADVVGNMTQGRMDTLALQSGGMQNEMAALELKAAKSGRVDPKKALEEYKAKAEMGFRSLSAFKSLPPEARTERYGELRQGLAGIVDLPEAYDDNAISQNLAEAAYGVEAVGEMSKAIQDAEVMFARGERSAGEAIIKQAMSKYEKEPTAKTQAVYDTSTGKPVGTAIEINGRLYDQKGAPLDMSRVTTDKQISKQEEGGPGAFTKKEGQELRTMEAERDNTLGLIDRVRDQIKAGGPSVLGLAGSTARVMDSVAEQLPALVKAMGGVAEVNGKQVSEETLRDATLYEDVWKKSFGGVAAQSAALKANLIDLAYANARANDPGGRLSDKEVKEQLEKLSAKGIFASTEQLLAVLDEMEMNISRKYRTRAKSLNQEVPEETKPEVNTRLNELKARLLGK